jgi:hypothetical protein
MVDEKDKKTEESKYQAKKLAAVGGSVALILVAVGLLFVGHVFIIISFTGSRPIAALIFGALCVIGAFALIINQIINLFRKKPGSKPSH